MNIYRISMAALSGCFLSSVVIAQQQAVPFQQAPVYQAQAGAIPQIQPNPAISSQQPQYPAAGGISSLQGDSAIPAKAPEIPNPFLEYYSRQGADFSAKIYYQDGKELATRELGADELKKAVVVFFGDWCPHCENFLKGFSQNMEFLKLYGINIIFINVPSIERLRNWQEPNINEFNAAENKLSAYSIKFSNKTIVGLLGDNKVTLAKNAIDGLPVFVAIKDGKEMFRAVGENTTSKLNFANQDVLKQFLGIWVDEKKEEAEKVAKEKPKTPKKKSSKKKALPLKQKKTSKVLPFDVDMKKARSETAKLNKFDYSVVLSSILQGIAPSKKKR